MEKAAERERHDPGAVPAHFEHRRLEAGDREGGCQPLVYPARMSSFVRAGYCSASALALVLALIQFTTDGFLARPFVMRGFSLRNSTRQRLRSRFWCAGECHSRPPRPGRPWPLLAAATLPIICGLVGTTAETALATGDAPRPAPLSLTAKHRRSSSPAGLRRGLEDRGPHYRVQREISRRSYDAEARRHSLTGLFRPNTANRRHHCCRAHLRSCR
jgi:hypothetical protein